MQLVFFFTLIIGKPSSSAIFAVGYRNSPKTLSSLLGNSCLLINFVNFNFLISCHRFYAFLYSTLSILFESFESFSFGVEIAFGDCKVWIPNFARLQWSCFTVSVDPLLTWSTSPKAFCGIPSKNDSETTKCLSFSQSANLALPHLLGTRNEQATFELGHRNALLHWHSGGYKPYF